MKTAFVYTDRYFEYDYGFGHPLKIERLKLTFDVCKAYKLFDLDQTSLVEGAPATEAEILRFLEKEVFPLIEGRVKTDE